MLAQQVSKEEHPVGPEIATPFSSMFPDELKNRQRLALVRALGLIQVQNEHVVLKSPGFVLCKSLVQSIPHSSQVSVVVA